MMSLQIPIVDPDGSMPSFLILALSILFGAVYFFVWRTGVMFRGGIDRTATPGQRRVRFMLSSGIISVWTITIGYLIFIMGVLPSYVTLVLVVLLGLALFDLFRQHSNL